jgi:hypothetical protein
MRTLLLTTSILIALSVAPCAPAVGAAAPLWMEPRSLNIVDIAGQVPDAVLADNILVFGAAGIMQYVSTQRDGNWLLIHTRVYPRRAGSEGDWTTVFPLLGQRPLFDHPGSVAPESWVRISYQGRDVTTSMAGGWLDYSEPLLRAAETNAAQGQRYPSLERHVAGFAVEARGVPLPANWGGEFKFLGDYPVLDAVFAVAPANVPQVTYLGQQEDGFPSYIGAGGVGVFQPLMEQLRKKYADRHPRIALSIPEGANYVMFTYPPMPFDTNDSSLKNLGRPIAGTVRLALDNGMLSHDLTAGGAFPLRAVWQDADQSAGPFLSLMPPVNRFTPPEYVVPAGMAYDPCFLTGRCRDSVLQTIYQGRMTMRTIYLKVEPRPGNLTFVPLKAVDETWRGQNALRTTERSLTRPPIRAVLPVVWSQQLPAAPVYPTTRPAGLFDPSTGRMVAYLWQ